MAIDPHAGRSELQLDVAATRHEGALIAERERRIGYEHATGRQIACGLVIAREIHHHHPCHHRSLYRVYDLLRNACARAGGHLLNVERSRPPTLAIERLEALDADLQPQRVRGRFDVAV